MRLQAYRRTQPTPIHVFGKTFDFLPNVAGHVVCDVDDERAVSRLLAIPEAFREYAGDATPAPVAAPVAAAPAPIAPAPLPPDDGDDDAVDPDAVLKGSDALPAEIEIAPGVVVTQTQIIEGAFATSGFDRQEWNQNDEDDREAMLEREVLRLKGIEDAKAAQALADGQAQQQSDQASVTATPPAADAPAVDPLVLTAPDGTVLDLNTYSATKLREFATEQGISLPGGNSTKVGDLRLMVAQALTGAAE